MATILIVDDRPLNRSYLSTLLGATGYQCIEAGDGAEGLAAAQAVRPDLILTDILMPRMDGYEFVSRLRKDPGLTQTPVVFISAAYRQIEAWQFAEECGVQFVLTKPAEPEEVLKTVRIALDAQGISSPIVFGPKVGAVEKLNLRFTTLLEAGIDLASSRDPERLLQCFCRAARDIIAARYAVAMIRGTASEQYAAAGCQPQEGRARAEILEQWLRARLPDSRAPWRATRIDEPELLPPIADANSILLVPIATHTGMLGWLAVMSKIGAATFSEEDERVAMTLAAQMAIAMENAKAHQEVERRAEIAQARLEERTADLLNEQERLRLSTDALEEVTLELEAVGGALSNDLRPPLRSIEEIRRLLADHGGQPLDDATLQNLDRIGQAAARMNARIDGLLDQLHLVTAPLVRGPIDLSDLAAELLSELQRREPRRLVETSVARGMSATGDLSLLRPALRNLLEIAWSLAARAPLPRIDVGLARNNGTTTFFVQDNGPGFDREHADGLFTPFNHRKGRNDRQESLGLGTARRVIRRHGGSIWAESDPGRGSTFFFTLAGEGRTAAGRM